MKIVKNILKIFAFGIFVLFVGFFSWASDKHVVPIMMYHHVDNKNHHELNTVSPENFEKQMAYLKRHGFHVIRFDELVSATAHHTKLPPKSVVITFDDGYLDNYLYAYPVLEKYQFPATIFVPSDLMNTTEGFLTWDQIKVMMNSGLVSIGSHTRTHVYLPDYPDFKKVEDEVVTSKRIIEEKIGKKVEYFCYPSGGFTYEIKDLLRRAGYKGACTTNRGRDRYNKDVFELKRVRFNNKDYGFSMWMKLSGYNNLFRKSRTPYSRGN